MKQYTSLLKIKLITLSLFFCVQLYAGDKVGNGGFAYKNSKRLLSISIQTILNYLPDRNDPLWNEKPENHDRFRRGIENLESLENSAPKFRNQRALMFDYDDSILTPKVIALKPYFDAFAAVGPESEPLFLDEVSRRILHEAGHLIELNNEESQFFAEQLLSQIKQKQPITATTNTLAKTKSIPKKLFICSTSTYKQILQNNKVENTKSGSIKFLDLKVSSAEECYLIAAKISQEFSFGGIDYWDSNLLLRKGTPIAFVNVFAWQINDGVFFKTNGTLTKYSQECIIENEEPFTGEHIYGEGCSVL